MTPKVLVISNECFSKTSSNGRTLGNFFLGWPKEQLAQFFLIGKPDAYYCDQYFQISDRQALNALLHRDSVGGEVLLTDDEAEIVSAQKRKKSVRNALTMLGRSAIWKTKVWQKNGFWNWIDTFAPDIVLLQAGDCAFMYDLAVETAKHTNAKLAIYNSEGYYYKDFDYFRGTGLAHTVYPLFKRQLKKSLEKAYAMAGCVFYICDELKEAYAKDFSGYAETIFTGSEIRYAEKAKKNDNFTTVYLGNLGLKRHESLMDIAQTLQEISKNLYVDVYGKATSEEVANALNTCCGIRYHGMVPYEKVKEILRDSDLLLHVESFDPFYQEDVKFGFSTKIADSLSSGNCFLLYAPEHFACFQYLKNNDAAYTASSKQEMEMILRNLVDDPKARARYRENALTLAEKNHRTEKNNEKFQSVLRKLVD